MGLEVVFARRQDRTAVAERPQGVMRVVVIVFHAKFTLQNFQAERDCQLGGSYGLVRVVIVIIVIVGDPPRHSDGGPPYGTPPPTAPPPPVPRPAFMLSQRSTKGWFEEHLYSRAFTLTEPLFTQ